MIFFLNNQTKSSGLIFLRIEKMRSFGVEKLVDINDDFSPGEVI